MGQRRSFIYGYELDRKWNNSLHWNETSIFGISWFCDNCWFCGCFQHIYFSSVFISSAVECCRLKRQIDWQVCRIPQVRNITNCAILSRKNRCKVQVTFWVFYLFPQAAKHADLCDQELLPYSSPLSALTNVLIPQCWPDHSAKPYTHAAPWPL